MSKVFEDKGCAELLLQIILKRSDLKVIKVVSQYPIKNLQGRSVRLDIYAEDQDGRKYNIEIQWEDKGAGAKRARYNISLIDANITEPGDDFSGLAESYVIFITERAVLKGGKPIYHIDRVIAELDNAPFGDEAHIIYVNSQMKDDTELGRLMHDFSCVDAADMKYSILADRVRYFKEDEEGVETMCKVMEDMRMEAAATATRNANINSARRMLAKNKLSYEEIAEYSGLTVADVEDLAKQTA